MAKHGGGMTWQPITYDPELNLIFVTTGNPQPVIAHKNRPGDNLFTASIVALNPDTGKMAWYFQSSPHDTHDWDSTQTAVLIDGDDRRPAAQARRAGGAQRPLLPARSHQRQGDRVDRVREDELVARLRREGTAGAEPGEDAADRRRAGVAESGRRGQLASAELQPGRPDCSTCSATRAFSVFYLYDPSDNPQGWGGTDRGGYSESMVQAIDYKTGQDSVEPPVGRGGAVRAAQHGRQPAVQRGARGIRSSRSMRRPATRSGTRG